MYSDDSVMCCLFPNRCNLFPQTPVVIFSNTMEYLNIIIVLSSPIIIVWSLLQIVLQFVEKKESILIDQNDSEDSCSEEPSLRKDVETKCTEEYLSDENNSDGYGDRLCSDSDLNVSNSLKRRLNEQDESSSDCYNSQLGSSKEVINIDMTNLSRRSSSSGRRNCNSSTSDEREERNHSMEEHCEQLHDIKIAAIHMSMLTVVPEEELQFLNKSQEDTNNDSPRNTSEVPETDSINQQQRQNKHSDHPT